MGKHSFYHHELFRHAITAFTFFFFFFFLVILKCMCFRSPRDTHRSISVSCFLRHQIYTFFQCVKQIRAHSAIWDGCMVICIVWVVFPLKGFRLVPEKFVSIFVQSPFYFASLSTGKTKPEECMFLWPLPYLLSIIRGHKVASRE